MMGLYRIMAFNQKQSFFSFKKKELLIFYDDLTNEVLVQWCWHTKPWLEQYIQVMPYACTYIA